MQIFARFAILCALATSSTAQCEWELVEAGKYCSAAYIHLHIETEGTKRSTYQVISSPLDNPLFPKSIKNGTKQGIGSSQPSHSLRFKSRKRLHRLNVETRGESLQVSRTRNESESENDPSQPTSPDLNHKSRKKLPHVKTVLECQARALEDPACGNKIYSNGVKCRCVLKGRTCIAQESKELCNVYHYTCPDVKGRCVHKVGDVFKITCAAILYQYDCEEADTSSSSVGICEWVEEQPEKEEIPQKIPFLYRGGATPIQSGKKLEKVKAKELKWQKAAVHTKKRADAAAKKADEDEIRATRVEGLAAAAETFVQGLKISTE